MQELTKRIGVFRVRKFTRGECILHAPKTTEGDFTLYVKPDGTLIYVPVIEVAP